MTVEEKMSYVANFVMGPAYQVEVDSDHKFLVLFKGETCMRVETTKDVNAHWQELIRMALRDRIDELIKIAIYAL